MACGRARWAFHPQENVMRALKDRVAHIEFATTVNGIPCRAQAVIQYGHDGGLWEPPCPTEVELTVLDRRGKPAPWLARMLDRHETDRIKKEALEADAEQWHDY